MKNLDLQAAWNYHNATKHSYRSVQAGPHFLDWDNQPLPFKLYPKLEPIRLPEHLASAGVPALDAIAAAEGASGAPAIPSLQALAEILYLAAGITKRKRYPGGEILFRAAACTGALYHIDLYPICGELPGLAAGVYHFGPHDFSLRRLRSGDYRSAVAAACGAEPAISEAPVIVASASTYWRNAWKYRARAYRHCYWDNGTILANLLAAASARRLRARIVLGFEDALVGRLLGLDPLREGTLSLVALGEGSPVSATGAPAIEEASFETEPLSRSEVDYPEIRAMHEASSLESGAEAAVWRERARETEPAAEPGPTGKLVPLEPLGESELPRDSLEEVVQRRGSTRRFAREAIGFRQLSTMIERATRPIPGDFTAAPLNDLYLIVNAVDGLVPGAYVYRRAERALELLKEGDFRSEAGYLGLGQEIPADCSVNVYFLADLHRVLGRFGNRGYRAALLEAAITGGRLYLAAYALGLGASGLTFFDDDVIDFFSPHASRKSVMFLVALGKSASRPRKR
ncbi:MAG TPA: SagB family peptide dehydrogenase [candidate division Zixibacteria bacterium]|nr:SagB family peptide dehydrogenase [candidate division Zixibacteria bacterium]